tara:strand:+ start:225 stop:416 length:192 start_codon:yes stop_codon:yes gene_type:complete
MQNWNGKDIRELRKRYQLSQEAFGKLLGVSRNYIHLLEKGVKKQSKTLEILLNFIEQKLEKGE